MWKKVCWPSLTSSSTFHFLQICPFLLQEMYIFFWFKWCNEGSAESSFCRWSKMAPSFSINPKEHVSPHGHYNSSLLRPHLNTPHSLRSANNQQPETSGFCSTQGKVTGQTLQLCESECWNEFANSQLPWLSNSQYSAVYLELLLLFFIILWQFLCLVTHIPHDFVIFKLSHWSFSKSSFNLSIFIDKALFIRNTKSCTPKIT